MVVVDRFSKAAHFGALPSHYTAFKVASLFIDMVCKHHGFPRSIISDRDPIFISNFWRDLFKLCGTKLRMSMSYHPETDGQTEVLNRTLEQYLRSFVHEKPSQWYNFLSLAEWSYNTSIHSSIGITPFEVVYGKSPPSIPQYLLGTSQIEAVDSILSSRHAMLELLKQRLTKAQNAMKIQADHKRRDISYAVGDWVYVKLRPYRQTSVATASYTKLSKRFYGPFQITKKIGQVSYQLQLPETAKIHPVFHCSLLKQHQGPLVPSSDPLPSDAYENHPLVEPLAILEYKWDHNASPPSLLVLVQWLGLSPEDTGW